MIPKTIWQTHKFEYENLPGYILAPILTWQHLNPGYEYKYSSNEECFDFVKDNFDKNIYDIFSYKNMSIRNRFDIWRILCIYHFGGIYADCDLFCMRPIDVFLDLGYDFITKGSLDENKLCFSVGNDFLASSQKSKAAEIIIDKMMEECSKKIKSNHPIQTYHTGPPLYIGLYNEIFAKDSSLNFKLYEHNFGSEIIEQGVFDIVGSVTWNDIMDGTDFSYLNSIYSRYIEDDDYSVQNEIGWKHYHRLEIKASRKFSHGG